MTDAATKARQFLATFCQEKMPGTAKILRSASFTNAPDKDQAGIHLPANLVIRAIEEALSTPTPAGELREVDGWQPIATAPKDGTEVMVWAVDEEAYDDAEDEADFQQRPYPARCNFQGIWWLSGGCMKMLRLATHWRPLLTGPRTLAQPGSGEVV